VGPQEFVEPVPDDAAVGIDLDREFGEEYPAPAHDRTVPSFVLGKDQASD